MEPSSTSRGNEIVSGKSSLNDEEAEMPSEPKMPPLEESDDVKDDIENVDDLHVAEDTSMFTYLRLILS